MNKCSCGAEFEGKFCPQCGTPVQLTVCAKCGTEYDGNFCPNCGTPKQRVCPQCGAKVGDDAKFCKNCGFALDGQAPAQQTVAPVQQTAVQQNAATQQKAAQQNVDWKQNKTLRGVLLYAPLAIFSLWAVLLWALMAAPMDIFGSTSVYALLTEGGPAEFDTAFAAAAAFMAFAALSTLYAGLLTWFQFKKGNVARWLGHYACGLLYLVIIVLTSVLAVEMMGASSAFVGATLALTLVLLAMHVAALVMCKLLKVSTITPEEREQAKQNFDAWRERCKQKFIAWRNDFHQYGAYKKELEPHYDEYKKERKLAVKQTVKDNSFRNIAAGIVSVCTLAILIVGVGVSFSSGLAQLEYYGPSSITDSFYFFFVILAGITFIMSVLTMAFSFSKHWRAARVFASINFVMSLPTLGMGVTSAIDLGNHGGIELIFLLICVCVVLILSIVTLILVASHINNVRRHYKKEYDAQTVERNEPSKHHVVRHFVVCKNLRESKTNVLTKVLVACLICAVTFALLLGAISMICRLDDFGRNEDPYYADKVIGFEPVYFLLAVLAFSFTCVAADLALKHKQRADSWGWVSMSFSLIMVVLTAVIQILLPTIPEDMMGATLPVAALALSYVMYIVCAAISAYFALTSLAGPFCARLREYDHAPTAETTDLS